MATKKLKVVKNADLVFLQTGLTGKGISSKPSALHRMGVSRRLTQVTNALKEINEGLNPDDDYKKFSNELEDLKKKNADRDEAGKIVEKEYPDGRGGKVKLPVIEKKREKHLKDVALLRKKYKAVIDTAKQLEDSYNDTLMAPVNCKFAPIKFGDFVKEKTTFEELFAAYPLIEEFDKDPLLKKKMEITLTVKDIIGDMKGEEGLADIDNMRMFNKFDIWDLCVVLTYNMRQIREKGMELNNDPIYLEYKKDFDKARIQLCEDFSEKNDNGEAIRTQMGYKIPDLGSFNIAFEELKEKKKALQDKFDKWLESEVNLEVVDVSKYLSEIDEKLKLEEMELTLEQSELLTYFVSE